MRSAFLVSATILAAASAGCGQSRAESAGATVDRQYQVGEFEQIEVAGPYQVEVRTGPNASVSARGAEQLLERTVVEVEDGRLSIHPRKEGWFGNRGWKTTGKASFTVTVPALSAATIAGSGQIRIDRIRGDRFEGSVAGSGDIDVETVEVQHLKLAIAGSGDIRAGRGRAARASYEIAGSGAVEAGAVEVSEVKVSIAGSGGVNGRATGSANVDIGGSGDVSLTGGAKCSVSKMGSGNVRCS